MFQEDEMPEVEIDIDELLEFSSDEEKISKLQVEFILDLLLGCQAVNDIQQQCASG